ncbi:MAG: PDDEXK nuclease domain-containing protein [Candidatus Endonucleobacter bathymodioli]|uniref:PDDEXK nuclease domain-containing protein n=1 Tax=Candidatus Endonucleibacter bathymodioli TaxID=539814 RepID=A0AA90SS16_9GAMM|nr:PDDEXK nuclease domain-containing protein [Candidatus Endonucleobacter bathymodioli]
MNDLTNINESQFGEVLAQIQQAKQQAFQQVNKTLVQLYWNIGQYVSNNVEQAGWGKGVVGELADFIQQKEPNMNGFSARNIWRMKQFYEIYREFPKLSTLWTVLPWSHNRRIMTLKTAEEREFYLLLCSKKKYSFRELERLIKTGTFERTMLANKKRSPVVSELPKSTDGIFKDSYVFEFLDLPIPHKEKDLQQALFASLKDFILELGFGFTFIGQEYRLQVGNDDFVIDLLFFHRQLQCMVAIELKTDKFKPAYLGQLEFYLEALDQNVKLAHENPSIGILLCREKDDEVVKLALNRSLSPTVIADYETKLIPKELLRQKLNEFYALLEGGDS